MGAKALRRGRRGGAVRGMRRNIAVERGRDIDIVPVEQREMRIGQRLEVGADDELPFGEARAALDDRGDQVEPERRFAALELDLDAVGVEPRSAEHTSELQSLMRISYAVF